ncbi:hypothetical protein BgiMline_019553 [Biomphalaria glabrata]|uniref:Uncharacterized protein LOC106058371 isoform X1 n=1 Tax=Biomphalaria glabrata TaxID=6526 RepID=A0A9U8E3J9_BIOGL|nr:uncharacterized protein LOC106058371 isoform X1 [Biomphalaria glabrata]KAI8727771.1 hypothetical protein BgiMline_033297 [Biomphalaria glabrata]
MKRIQIQNSKQQTTDLKDEKNDYDVLLDVGSERSRYESVYINDEPYPTPVGKDLSEDNKDQLLADLLHSQSSILAEMKALRRDNILLRETLTLYTERQDTIAQGVQDQLRKITDQLNGHLVEIRKELDAALNKSLFDFMDKHEKLVLTLHDQLSQTSDHLSEKLMKVSTRLDRLTRADQPVQQSADKARKKSTLSLPSL